MPWRCFHNSTEDLLCRIITIGREKCLWNKHFDSCTWNSAAQSEHTLCTSSCKGASESAKCRNCKCPTKCCTTFFLSKNMLWPFYLACFCVDNTVTAHDVLLHLIKGFITEGHITVFFVQNWSVSPGAFSMRHVHLSEQRLWHVWANQQATLTTVLLPKKQRHIWACVNFFLVSCRIMSHIFVKHWIGQMKSTACFVLKLIKASVYVIKNWRNFVLKYCDSVWLSFKCLHRLPPFGNTLPCDP
jgi:hypothetical protein